MMQKKEKKETINVDEVLFKIWFIINAWDDILMQKLTATNIKSIEDVKKKSLYELFEFVSSIDWDKCNKFTTKKDFLDNVEQINESKQQQQFALSYNQNNFNNNSLPMRPTRPPHTGRRGSWGYRGRGRGGRGRYGSRGGRGRSGGRDRSNHNNQRSRMPTAAATNSMRNNSIRDSVPRSAPMRQSMGRGRGRGGPARGRGGGRGALRSKPMPSMGSAADQNIGFSVGGAQDINAFRDSIKNDKMPQLKSITFEGIYYDYYFDTNSNEIGDEMDDFDDDNKENEDENENENELPLFYPSYCYSKSKIPKAVLMSSSTNITKKTNDMIDDNDDDSDNEINEEFDFHINDAYDSNNNYDYFMTVGLNSNMKEKDFQRKKLNLVVVLDISGSMCGGWTTGNSTMNKMKTANQCILALLTHLNYDDRFGLVLFDHSTRVHMNFAEMKDHKFFQFQSILNIEPCGGTNFELGFNAGMRMFDTKLNDKFADININDYENRMVFLTDACPNIGATDPNSLMNLVKKAANNADKNKRVYTTFVGVGLDFNVELIEEITKVRGANYFAVHSAADFIKKLDTEFDYFVSPMVFDLKLVLQSEGNNDNECIEAVYGSNDIDTKSGEIMKINTLFPSPPNDEGEIKGGIVLIKLKQNMNNKNLIINCSFEDKFGKKFKNTQNVVLSNKNKNEFYPNLGVRKGVLLTRYVLLIKQWIKAMNDEESSTPQSKYYRGGRGRGGRGSYYQRVSGRGYKSKLAVTNEYKQIFQTFKKYFKNEMKILKDEELKQEIEILNKLISK